MSLLCFCLLQGEQISFNGRSLMVMPAISRSDAQDLRVKKSTKEAKDSRNLFLAREGCELHIVCFVFWYCCYVRHLFIYLPLLVHMLFIILCL